MFGEEALADAELVLRLASEEDRVSAQHAAGWLFWFRFVESDGPPDQADLLRALDLLRPVYQARPDIVPPPVREAFALLGHEPRQHARIADYLDRSRLNAWAIELSQHYQATGDESALAGSTAIFRRLIDTVPTTDPAHPAYLNNLGNNLLTQYKITGDPALLDTAAGAIRLAIDRTPNGDPDEASRHNNLGNVLKNRGTDLNAAITSYRRSIALTIPGDPGLPSRLSNLGAALEKRPNSTATSTTPSPTTRGRSNCLLWTIEIA